MCKIFCITNRHLSEEDFLNRIERIAEAHPDGIILREKTLTGEEYKVLGEKVMEICRKYQVPCIFHTFVEEARELGGKAIHLPLPVLREFTEEERIRLKRDFITVGTSCHSLEEAKEAEDFGCTYFIAGHIFNTDCKKGIPGRGTGFLKDVCSAVSIPGFAIGGIQEETIECLKGTGAAGFCVMSSIMQCESPQKYLRNLRSKFI